MTVLSFVILGCSGKEVVSSSEAAQPILQEVLTSNYDDEIVPIGDIDTHPLIQSYFGWYTHLLSPSGEPVMILAQSEVSRAHIMHVRNHLAFGLVEPSSSGLFDFDGVFNEMANNKASILMFEGPAQETAAISDGLLDLDWQVEALLLEDTVLPGSSAWLNNDHIDLSLSTVYSLLFQTGWNAVDTSLQNEMIDQSNSAIDGGVWQPVQSEQESGSVQSRVAAYFSQLVSIDFGHWQHTDEPWDGEWTLNSRSAISDSHPDGFGLIRSLVPEYYTPEVILDSELAQSITMLYDSGRPESAKSQYWLSLIHI